MRLKDFREQNGITMPEAAEALNTTVSSIVRWENGSRDPDRATKERIFLWSKGEVEPNDFYDVPAWRRALDGLLSKLRGKAA